MLSKIQKRFVKYETDRLEIPILPKSKNVRMKAIFIGEVQNVGFRIVISKLASKMNLTGWVKNLSNDNVEAEIQGDSNKINHLLKLLKDHKRIQVDHANVSELSLEKDEMTFEIIR